MNVFFGEEEDEALRYNFKTLEQTTYHHAKGREDAQEEREA